ncbi:MAG: hypothetical protein IT372_08375 [Polyangiaceae bacterium]|nr:hypothetical protein [Polyangiaceae bacterium]
MRLLFYDNQDLDLQLAAGPRSIFLAGPTARGLPRTPWRVRALELLGEVGYAGLVVIPEFCDGQFEVHAPEVFDRGNSPVPTLRSRSYHVLRWETCGIERSSIVLFWMPFGISAPDDPGSLPGFTTRAEVSRELARDPTRLVLGMPRDVLAGGHIRYHAHAAGVRIHETLEETVREAASRG